MRLEEPTGRYPQGERSESWGTVLATYHWRARAKWALC